MTARRPSLALVAAAAALLAAAPRPPAAVAGDGPPAPPPAPVPAAAPGAPARKPPPYDVLRYREDWDAMRCVPVCDRCDVTDRVKALSLGGNGCVWVNVGGQARLRFEAWNEQNAGGIPGDDSWLLTRVRAHADLHLGDHLRLYAEGIYADQDERDAGPRPIDENHGDVQNLFAEGIGPTSGSGVVAGAWLGRRELLFGKQRLVGPLDWGNTRRTFEGGGAWAKGCDWRLDGFFVRPVLVEVDEMDEGDRDTELAGLVYQRTAPGGPKWEAYAFRLHRDPATWLKVPDEETRWTLGALAYGPIGGTRLDFEVEAAWQLGDFGSESISAGMVSAELGFKPCVPCLEPRFAVGADWASGDDGPGGDLGTFNQLFPTGHLWFGWADLIGRENLLALRLTATVKPASKVTVRVDLHDFWRASADDAVYNAAGGVLRAPSGDDEKHVGAEVDLQVKVAVDRHWDVEAGWAHFVPGAFLEGSGPHEDTDFGYLQATYTF